MHMKKIENFCFLTIPAYLKSLLQIIKIHCRSFLDLCTQRYELNITQFADTHDLEVHDMYDQEFWSNYTA